MFRLAISCIFLYSLVFSVKGLSSDGQIIRKTEVNNFETSIESTYRLPNNTKPDAYNIYIRTDIADGLFNFTGVVKIDLTVLEAGSSITLHHNGSTINLALLTNENGNLIPISHSVDRKKDFLIFRLENYTLSPGERVQLTIEYAGMLRPEDGFLHSFYKKSNGEKVWHAATHFQANMARHAFPCFDEPGLKATFDITIEHSSRYFAISNMPEVQKIVTGTRAVTTFERTPVMSTYTVAFVVSDMEFKEKITENGIKHRLFVQPGKIDRAASPLNESVQMLIAISNYLHVNYTLTKMDEVLIPDFYEDFTAMENWGLVTWKDAFLFPDKFNSSLEQRVRGMLAAHEFAHQWFGNLVTPLWWHYLWLSEGFGSLFEVITLDLVHPEWNIEEIFVVHCLQGSLSNDSTEDTIPMTYYVESPADVDSLFEEYEYITYQKAASVLRMFLHSFTENSFKKGLNYYLTESAFAAVTDKDLFGSLERAVKEDNTLDDSMNVNEIFGSWSNQRGYPLLIVTRNYVDNSIEIAQERYFSNLTITDTTTTWWIPYNFDTANNIQTNVTTPDDWLPQGTKRKVVTSSENKNWTSDDWVIFNKKQTGFYRILYDETNYKLISKQLSNGDLDKIHPFNRAQIINDLSHFVRSGRLSITVFFEMIKYLKKETFFAPLYAALEFLFQSRDLVKEGTQEHLKREESLCGLREEAVQIVCTFDAFSIFDEEFCSEVKQASTRQCIASITVTSNDIVT